jgi:methionyl-tRNA formyltransferase
VTPRGVSGGRRLRVAAFGSPEFALPSIEVLSREHDLVLVVSQSDKPAGRGMAPRTPAAAAWARAHGVALAQPERLRSNEAFLERLRALDLDVAVTAAYGKLLPPELLAIPREGVLNVHASLLPRYRGAAPVQRALIDGAAETGVTIMQTEAGLDTGPVRHVRRTTIGPDETAQTLLGRLAELGATALSEALALLARDELPSEPQDHDAATIAPRLTRADGRIRWEDDAEAVSARHRGVTPWPGSWFERTRGAGSEVVKVHAMERGALETSSAAGTIVALDEAGVHVATGRGTVVLRVLQSPGRPRQDAAAWARGARLALGDVCG